MLDKEALGKLKQTNVSADPAKTKARMSAVWKACGKDGQKKMADMVDAAVSTFRTAIMNGRISTKLAIPMAVVGDVDPAYLTGETDKVSSCTDQKIEAFLMAHSRKPKKDAPRRGRSKAAPAKAKTAGKRKSRAKKTSEILIEGDGSQYLPDVPGNEKISVITWAGEPDADIADAAFIVPEISELLAVADKKIAAFDPVKFAALDDLSFSDIEVLIRSLEIKMNASDSAKTLMRLVRLLLV